MRSCIKKREIKTFLKGGLLWIFLLGICPEYWGGFLEASPIFYVDKRLGDPHKGCGTQTDPYRHKKHAFLRAEEKILEGYPAAGVVDLGEGTTYSSQEVLTHLQERRAQAKERVFEFLQGIGDLPYEEKVDEISHFLLHTPYTNVTDHLAPWEQPQKLDPFIRLDAMDWLSYIEASLALARLSSGDLEDIGTFLKAYERELFPLMFVGGGRVTPSLARRHQFMEAEWVPHNRNVVKDVTRELMPQAPTTSALLDKRVLIMNQVQGYGAHVLQARERQAVAHVSEKMMAYALPMVSHVAYIPLTELSHNLDKYRDRLEGTYVVGVVVKDPTLKKRKGSDFNIVDGGLLFKKDGQLFYRHGERSPASEVKGEKLETYLQRFQEKTPPVPYALGLAFYKIIS
jgi:hypothetical protein